MQLLPFKHPNACCSAKSELHHLQGILMLPRAVPSDLGPNLGRNLDTSVSRDC